MSILIMGMEMPTSCEECPLGDSLHCQVLPSVPALWAEYTNAIREKRLHSECPLVPVPKHRRLIDADALDIYRREEQAWHDYESNPDNEYLEGVKDGLHEAAKQLSTAPTIIPAEEVER